MTVPPLPTGALEEPPSPTAPLTLSALEDHLMDRVRALDPEGVGHALKRWAAFQDSGTVPPGAQRLTPPLIELLSSDDDGPEEAVARTAVLNRLLDAGANPNGPDPQGMPPLLWSAIHNRWSDAQRLVQAGADPHVHDRSKDRDTLLDHLVQDPAAADGAALSGLIAAGFCPERLVHEGLFNPLWLVQDGVCAWDDPARRRLLNVLFERTQGPLPGLDVNAAFGSAVKLGLEQCAVLLVEHGAQPQQPVTMPPPWPAPFTGTALHLAMTGGHRPMVQRLLTWGLDPNASDASGITPLHWAILSTLDRPIPSAVGIVHDLVHAGARADAPAAALDGATPLALAQRHAHAGLGTLEAQVLRASPEAQAPSVAIGAPLVRPRL